MAQQVIPKQHLAIASPVGGDTLCVNIRAANHKLIVPHTLFYNVKSQYRVNFERMSSPIIMAHVATHKLANEQGEVATARGIARILYNQLSYSTVDLQKLRKSCWTPHWFQFYFSKDDETSIISWTV